MSGSNLQASGVYLYHFSQPYHHAKHYCGYANNIAHRLEEHEAGHGARLTQVVLQAGISLFLARTWFGKDRAFERRLKNHNNLAGFCPLCRGQQAYQRMKG